MLKPNRTYINIDFEEMFDFMNFLSFSYVKELDNPRFLPKWEKYDPSNNDIDILFKEYYTDQFLEYFYDTEPDYDECAFTRYMAYKDVLENKSNLPAKDVVKQVINKYKDDEDKNYLKGCTFKDLKRAYDVIIKQKNEYNKTRIKINNWIELNQNGNWHDNQEAVDAQSKAVLSEIKQNSINKKNRFWILTKNSENKDVSALDDEIMIYYYGRDYNYCDFAWVLKKRN